MTKEVLILSGAGNVFVMLDGRDGFRPDIPEIIRLCREYRTDGLMILSVPSPGQDGADFTMEFYNPDGSGGMMCGNGGRCITAFAETLGIAPADGRVYRFEAADGPHTGEILSRGERCWTVRLGMKSVTAVEEVKGGYFLDTGTRHFVKFVEDVDAVDIMKEGPALRHDPFFGPVGTNVNFVQILPDGSLKVRTFEKGVEGETLACGTGITASAIAFIRHRDSGLRPLHEMSVRLHARIADLEVCFRRSAEGFDNVYLTGPVTYDRD